LQRGEIHVFRNPFTKTGCASLEELGIKAINECTAMMGLLDERIRSISQGLKRRAGKMKEARVLMTITGVGYFSA
jgi:hypothetical protein